MRSLLAWHELSSVPTLLEDETKALVQYLGSNRQIFWINNYAPGIQWIEANNTYLTKLAKEHPNVHTIDLACI